MLQKNHHFLFPQIYFGSLENLQEDLELEFDDDEFDDYEESFPWSIIFDPEHSQLAQQKIGLFIHWVDRSI